jgi:hypothetical protein
MNKIRVCAKGHATEAAHEHSNLIRTRRAKATAGSQFCIRCLKSSNRVTGGTDSDSSRRPERNLKQMMFSPDLVDDPADDTTSSL